MSEDKELVTLLTFLKDTRDGKYCKVEKEFISYPRVECYRIVIEDEYYYSYS